MALPLLAMGAGSPACCHGTPAPDHTFLDEQGCQSASVVRWVKPPANHKTENEFARQLRIVRVLPDAKRAPSIGHHLSGSHTFFDVTGADIGRFFLDREAQNISQALSDQTTSKALFGCGAHG